ncbi:MAG: hypothetical protein BWZ02_01940 [Lentisphaerae bacterium ADurb.BinA184]|nr:MAG: hypothetical protein BWZ02_01940 [Lentisphaerae bacterium ADurb.BinA184]
MLWVSLGGAGAWQAPEPVVIAPELGNARAGFDATGRPLVVWQQDKEYGNGNRASRAFVSRRFEEGWSAPVELLPPAAAARGAEEPELRAEARGKLSFLPKPPEECWKDADPEPEVGEDDPPEDPERPDPPPPDEPPGPEGEGDNARSNDPNEKDAPVGCGTLAGGRYVRPDQEFTFIIRFENVAAATAAAQEVTITDRLPDGMDWNTFRFGEVGIGEQVVADLAGSTGKTVEVVQESTGMTLRIEAAFDPQTGDVRWYLRCVDPSSPDGWPPDPADGFLPPNAAPPAGEGYVTYTLRPPPESLPDGQVVSGPHARIVFDYNDPIDTNSTTHTVDATTPATTAVRAWKSGAGNQVRLAAQGNDTGSGVAMFEVFADSARGRRLAGRGWQGAEAAFAGDWGAGYSLYVRAIDGVGNAEPVPAEPSATVRIPQWAFRLGVEGADAAELFIATDATAADGWDEGLDEDVTTRDADAWLEGPAGHDRLRYDVRPPAADVVWILRTGADTDDPRPTTHDLRSTTLSWNPAAIPANQHLWLVQLDDGQTPLPDSLIALRTQSTTEFADGATYALHLSDSLPASLPLAAGWNLLSLPLAPADPDPAKVFGPRAAGRLWAWQPAARAGGQFVRPDTIEAPHGYWVFADSATGLLVSGTPPAAGPVALDPGWNLVGVAVPSAMPAIRGLAPWAWAWQDGRYAPTTTLQPAVGYWLYWDAEAPAEVTLPPR